ncbi:hypothetical protein CAPTEDRAFT_217457 [Capitella teleta]|uniref:SUEL-type lectin domain-containing protein n=1 Tax=Capitella teleta TaxID=283909 RepID=R7UHR1_CAPTE|nr:hypothetical protein CAPTEDRAFT_217457 [Capitella teleta]|eukprot:ELU05613.1 hypothetical protein CAPTEDRAFT_217457 [Capitella teleta]
MMDYLKHTFGLLCILLFKGSCDTIRHEWGTVTSEEYCDHESFKAQCNNGYNLQIINAMYGQMKLGKCVKIEAYLGCQTSVTQILQQKCNMQQECLIDVQDNILRDTQPCEVGIAVYIDVTFACIKVTSGEYCDYENFSAQCNSGYKLHVVQALYGQMELGKCVKVDAYLGCQTDVTEIMRQKCNSHNRCEMYVHDKILRDTQPCELGVSVYLSITFSCIEVVVDDATQEQMTLTLNGQDEQVVGMSTTNSVSLVLDEIYDAPPFIIGYRAYGCPDISGPKGTHVERDGSEATVKCIDTEQKWHLKCRGVHWIGVIGTCTQMGVILCYNYSKTAPATRRPQTQPTPIGDDDKLLIERDIVYLIVICATVFLSVLVITTGYVCLKRAQIARGVSKPKPPPEAEWAFGANQTMTLLAKTRPDSDYLHPAAYQLDDSQSMPTAVYDTPLPNPPTIKRNNDEDYNATVSSTSTDYKKYFVLDKDYMNTKEFINNV